MGAIQYIAIAVLILLTVHVGVSHAQTIQCPDVAPLSDVDLARIVARERSRRNDLPPPFEKFEVEVSRTRCLYSFLEDKIPDDGLASQLFVISPFGEIVNFSGINEQGDQKYQSHGTVIGRGEVVSKP